MFTISYAQDRQAANVCVLLQQAIAYEKPMAKGEPVPAAAKTGTAPATKTGTAAALSGSVATSGACNSEAADETAPLNVFSNPLYTCATPKHVC